MKALFSIATIALWLAVAVVAPCREISLPRSKSTCEVSDVALMASVDSRVPAPPKKTLVPVELKNNSKRDVYTTGGSGFHIDVFTRDGQRVRHTAFGEGEAEDGKPTILHPGQSEHFEYDIRSRFQLDKPDLYKVVIQFIFDDQDDNDWGVLEVSLPFYVGNPPTPWKQPAGGI